jgi:hypothetical protein
MSSMTVAQARQFLVDRVVDEAKREGVALTDVEIRMLEFSEASASPEDKEAAAVFERDYNDEQYENKITLMLRTVYERDIESGLKPDWDESLDELALEDMYLFVMLEKAGIVKTTSSLSLPDWRLLRGLVPALLFIAAGIIVAFTPFGTRLLPNLYLRLGLLVVLWAAPFLIGKFKGKPIE